MQLLTLDQNNNNNNNKTIKRAQNEAQVWVFCLFFIFLGFFFFLDLKENHTLERWFSG